MKRLVLSLALAVPALAACSSTPAAKGTIPPGTPPPEYEPARTYDPSAAPPPATSAAPAAPATAAPAAPASAAPTAPAPQN